MTHGSLTRLRLLKFSSALILCLSACQPIPEKVVAPPPPQTNEVAKAICLRWLQTEPTWADEDTELTKDLIDLNIRTREDACRDYG